MSVNTVKNDGSLQRIASADRILLRNITDTVTFLNPSIFTNLSNKIKVYRYGNVVQISMDSVAVASGSAGGYKDMVSGLPAPFTPVDVTGHTLDDDISARVKIYIDTTGKMVFRNNTADAAGYVFGFHVTYLTND